jgi:hypothetical protein
MMVASWSHPDLCRRLHQDKTGRSPRLERTRIVAPDLGDGARLRSAPAGTGAASASGSASTAAFTRRTYGRLYHPQRRQCVAVSARHCFFSSPRASSPP